MFHRLVPTMKTTTCATAVACGILTVAARAPEKYDAVVVGGGPAGLVMASRLSENPAFRVLVLENGPETYENINVTTPAWEVRLPGTQFSWNFTTVPQPALDGRAIPLEQGNGWGGGSAINYMAYCRGSRSVFDEWASISGIDELRWDKLLPYFRRSAQLTVPDDRDYEQIINSTVFGPDNVHVSYESSTQYYPIDRAFRDVWAASGAHDADLNAGDGIGMILGGPSAVNPSNGTRSYALPAYGWKMAGRPNAKMLHGARAIKVNFEGTRVVGVDYVDLACGQTHTVVAPEVVVSAGAINTPRLLLLSGVGPKEHLAEVGVPVVVDSPDVGARFKDHPIVAMMFNASPQFVTARAFGDPATLAPLLAEYRANGTGPLSVPGGSSFATERVPDAVLDSFGVDVTFQKQLPQDRPHLLYQYVSGPMLAAPPGANAVSSFVALVQPEQAGTVQLQTADWRDAPRVGARYFGSAGDAALVRYGYRKLLAMMRSAAVDAVSAGELYPDYDVTSEAAVRGAIANATITFHHPASTCSLGHVLDQRFRVRGVQGLRVVDSSAIPVLPTCHLQASVYALAEYAATVLAADFW